MANFTIDKTLGHGDGTITIKPNLELTGRGPYRSTLVVKSSHDSNLQRTVSCVKIFPLTIREVTVSGCPSPNGEYNSIPMSESISIPATDYYVKFSASTNAKKINIPAVAFTYIAIGVNSMWLQPDGTLGNSQVDCRTAISNAVTIPDDPGSLSSYNLKIIVGFSENKSEFSRSTSFSIFLVGSDDSDTQLLFSGKVVQSAGFKTYGNITITEFSYPYIPATGGTVNPVLSYYQAWGWNGQTTGGGSITSGADISYTGVGVDTSSGAVTRESNESTSERNIEVTVSIEMNGKSATKDTVCKQEGATISIVPYVRPMQNYVLFDDTVARALFIELDTNVNVTDIETLSLNSQWCVPALSNSGGKIRLRVGVRTNDTTKPRSCVVIVKLRENAMEEYPVTVVQWGNQSDEIMYFTDPIHIGTQSYNMVGSVIPRSFTQLKTYVVADGYWEITSKESFTSMKAISGGESGVKTMTELLFNVFANDASTLDRNGSIEFTNTDFTYRRQYDFIQSGLGPYLGLDGLDVRNLTSHELELFIINLRTDVSKEMIEQMFSYEILDGGSEWISFNKSSVVIPRISYYFKVKENLTGKARTARIQFKYSDLLPIIITVNQSPSNNS